MKKEIEANGLEIWKFSVEFASQDPDLETLPGGSFINKTEPGCGLSTLVLENCQNVVVVVPTVALTKNKVRQYFNSQFDDEPFMEYPARQRFAGEMLAVYEGVLPVDIDAYIKRVHYARTPIKIMCVYDSLPKCEEFLDEINLLCIDEADSLTDWAQLKAISKQATENSDAISEVYRIAQENRDKTCFFSATVVEQTYLPEWVTQLRQIRMEWAGTVTPTPILMKRCHPLHALRKEILESLIEKGEVTVGDRTFTKVIVALNSVEAPTKIIREMDIPQDLVAVLSGANPRNVKKTKGRYKEVSPTDLPMISFITSAFWRGLDLWDSEAMTVVVSSTAKAWQMVDITTSLRQAIRRQRDKKNPNYDRFVFIYNQTLFEKSEEEILDEWEERHARLAQCCNVLNALEEEGRFEEFESARKTFSGNKEFVYYTTRQVGSGYVLNENLFQSQLRRLLVTRRSYTEGLVPIEQQMTVEPIVVPDPLIEDSTGWDGLRRKFVRLKNGEPVEFTEEQQLSDNYHLLQTCLEVFGELPKRADTARLKCSHIGNGDAQYEIDLVAPYQQGHRYSSKFIEQQIKGVYRKYGIEEKTTMQTNIKVLEFYGLKLQRIKSDIIYYDVLERPEQKF